MTAYQIHVPRDNISIPFPEQQMILLPYTSRPILRPKEHPIQYVTLGRDFLNKDPVRTAQ